jgi:hypothetical protein
MRTVLLIGLLGLACGCTGVYSRQPVGSEPKNLAAEAGEWKGTWTHGGGAIRVAVTDAEKGILTAGWVEDGGKGLEYQTAEIHLRTAGTWTFASLKDAKAKEETRYFWGRIQRQDKTVLVWLPDTAKFKRLIQAGVLPGEAPTNNSPATLETLSPSHLRIIASEQEGVLFNWEAPLVFGKIAD